MNPTEVCGHAVSDNSPSKLRRKRANPIPRERKILMRKRNKLRKQLIFAERERTESISKLSLSILKETYKSRIERKKILKKKKL